MQALTLLVRRLVEAVPQMHALRCRVRLAAVATLMQHPRLSIRALGRSLASGATPKYGIKRIDRLVGNPHLVHERPELIPQVIQNYRLRARPALSIRRLPS